MRYILNEDIALRGWNLLPYALVSLKTKDVLFLRQEEFHAVSFCNGLVDADWVFVDEKSREIIPKLAERGIVKPCENNERLNPEQEYVKYNCRYVKTAHWSITGRCNFKCRHCYMSAPDAKYGELSHEDCIKIIDDFAKCGVYHTTITGGEPLVRSDFWELVDRMLGHGMIIDKIYSNGALVNDTFLDRLEERHISPVIDISFDGVGWHDWLRGIPGAEKIATDAFRRCKERGICTNSEMCIHRLNIHTLRESVNLLSSLGVVSIKLSPVENVGAWKENGLEDQALPYEEILEEYLKYIPLYYEDEAPLSLQMDAFFMGRRGKRTWIDPSKRLCGNESALKSCLCGHARNNMYIAADGHLLPCLPIVGACIQDDFPVVTQVGLEECLQGSHFMKMVTLTLADYLKENPECMECEYKYYCGGGCRANALVDTGKFLSPDNMLCTIYKKGYAKRRDEMLKELGIKNQFDS